MKKKYPGTLARVGKVGIPTAGDHIPPEDISNTPDGFVLICSPGGALSKVSMKKLNPRRAGYEVLWRRFAKPRHKIYRHKRVR